MTVLEEITQILRDRRVRGGWIDEDVAALIFARLGLDENGMPGVESAQHSNDPTSSNIGHG